MLVYVGLYIRLIAFLLVSSLSVGLCHISPKSPRRKEKKNKTSTSRVPNLGVLRRRVRGDNLIVVFQLADMFYSSEEVLGGKYGLVRSMFSSSIGLFSFQFSFMDGLDAMLKNGPWFILEITCYPEDDVAIRNEDGLSVIDSKMGTPSIAWLFIASDIACQVLG
ncbi:hypothetical protein Tco_0868032 [Tanacetum coccineum]